MVMGPGLKCKYCGQILAHSSLSHESKNGQPCTSHFLEEQNWMEPLFAATGAVLNCPRCQHKVGSFAWAGLPCSCTQWVVPGFALIRSKVDPYNLCTHSNCRDPPNRHVDPSPSQTPLRCETRSVDDNQNK